MLYCHLIEINDYSIIFIVPMLLQLSVFVLLCKMMSKLIWRMSQIQFERAIDQHDYWTWTHVKVYILSLMFLTHLNYLFDPLI